MAATPDAAATSADPPIDCLGFRGLDFWYRRRGSGEVIELHARDHTASGIIGLCGGDIEWVSDFADRNDNPDWAAVAQFMIAKCFTQGLYTPKAAVAA